MRTSRHLGMAALALVVGAGLLVSGVPGTSTAWAGPKKRATTDKTPKKAKKASSQTEQKPQTAWGIRWEPSVKSALDRANGKSTVVPAKSKSRRTAAQTTQIENARPVLWMRVLGALTGDT